MGRSHLVAKKRKTGLNTLFQSFQDVLATNLRTARIAIEHPGTLGTASEEDWLRTLSLILPRRYLATTAFVVDSKDRVSEQQDLLICDRQYSPLLFVHNGATYVAAESVYAVFEIKQNLNARNIAYAGKKIASVRRLFRTSARIVHASGTSKGRRPFRILGGLLCLDTTWNPPFGVPFKKSLSRVAKEGRLDLGCVLRYGSFEAHYRRSNQPTVMVGRAETGLTFFVLRLLRRLQFLGTVPAIDFRKYEKHLSEPGDYD